MSARQKQDQRKKEFKKTISADEARRKREEASIELRKSKKDEQLQKRRNHGPAGDDALTTTAESKSVSLRDLDQNVAAICAADFETVLAATTYFRRLLSIGK